MLSIVAGMVEGYPDWESLHALWHSARATIARKGAEALLLPTTGSSCSSSLRGWGQILYEIIRPVVLFGLTSVERAKETGKPARTIHRRLMASVPTA